MKDIQLILIFLLATLTSFSQRELIDTSVFNHSTLQHLRDCRQYSVDSIKNVETTELVKSYAFDAQGNIIKIVETPSTPGSKPTGSDSTLAILTYDKNNNLTCRTNYCKCLNRDTLIELSKVINLYNSKGLIVQKIGLSQVEKTGLYDTMFVIDYTYNSKGLLQTENTRDIERGLGITGLNKYHYDEMNRLKEINFIASCCRLVEDKSIDNYNVRYIYFGDSVYKATQVFKLQPQRNSTYREYTYFTDKNGKLIKKIGKSISGEIILENGNYILNPESKDNRIYKTSVDYKYDKLGRIEKLIYHYKDEHGDWKMNGEYSTLFKYNDNKLYKLPDEEYLDVQ